MIYFLSLITGLEQAHDYGYKALTGSSIRFGEYTALNASHVFYSKLIKFIAGLSVAGVFL